MHTRLEPTASSDSWFVFSFVAKASQVPGSLSKPHAMPGNSWHPCLAALISVGAGAPAPACRLRPHGCHSPRHCHWQPRRHTHLQDIQQGRADKEPFRRIKASPPWQSSQPQKREGREPKSCQERGCYSPYSSQGQANRAYVFGAQRKKCSGHR